VTGGPYSEVIFVLILVGPDSGWSLLSGGRCSEVVVRSGLTVPVNFLCYDLLFVVLNVPRNIGDSKKLFCFDLSKNCFDLGKNCFYFSKKNFDLISAKNYLF
jgi:hypothetical protein